eukprot:scaffold10616_cov39-Attheya_sp.AAC.1
MDSSVQGTCSAFVSRATWLRGTPGMALGYCRSRTKIRLPSGEEGACSNPCGFSKKVPGP